MRKDKIIMLIIYDEYVINTDFIVDIEPIEYSDELPYLVTTSTRGFLGMQYKFRIAKDFYDYIIEKIKEYQKVG